MSLPEVCFCRCGESRSKRDTANLEGFSVAMELGRWIVYLNVMKAGDIPPDDLSQVERFMKDGATVYRLLVDEVHYGQRRDRGERKLTTQWTKFSKKSRKKAAKFSASEELPDPLELPLPEAQQVRAWVYEGVLPVEW